MSEKIETLTGSAVLSEVNEVSKVTIIEFSDFECPVFIHKKDVTHLIDNDSTKSEKDIHHTKDETLSVEIKGSSHPNQRFGNRSYAQPDSGNGQKNKDGYYITINFQKFSSANKHPEILIIRFGYLEHSDWIAQTAATGQQARLAPDVYRYKLKTLYERSKIT